MKTLKHEKAFPHQITGEQGLTKFEYMAIEFTKAFLSSGILEPNLNNIEYAAKCGINAADELIKQLNEK